ncbi:hypothetical protein PR202_gb04956 [Eleusine coracana subsp. coracana]|uniref:PHD-type domain-containing protein n=1 Tax=Eleusine coracana subsp. coracana TaxID=191504 RepID=A0AAV5E535_ELECO|nr:hypothetical protein PR202_gb04956 [Eleusine coracana subsp. coracana]
MPKSYEEQRRKAWKIMHLRMKVVAFVEILSSIEEFWIVANTGRALVTHLQFPTFVSSLLEHAQCIKLYDTTGATTEDEYPLASGDDDWYMQGESSALSFPSYYIDADAVDCLDDSDCKIRSGIVVAEGDSALDTSIACDSCDKWYHASCVGFNPELATGNSWLCPRCMPTEVKRDADVILKQNFSEGFVIGSDRTSTDASFSGRVSVSIADEGETALVVSMVGVHPESDQSEVSLGLKTTQEAFNGTSGPSYPNNDFTHDIVADASNLRNTDVFSRSQNKSSEMNTFCDVSSVPAERSLQFSPIRDSTTSLFSSEQGTRSNEQLEAPKLMSPCSFSDGTFSENGIEAENRGQENAVHKHNNKRPTMKSPEPSSPASKMTSLHDEFMIDADTVQQMKTPQNMELPLRHDEHKISDGREKKGTGSDSEVNRPAKKAKFEVQEQEMNLIENFNISSTHGLTTSVSTEATCGDMSEVPLQPPSIPDILSIVEEEDYRRDLGREQARPVGRRAGDKPGLRVKKIFRKEGKESSVLVQKLQQEIREVVRDTGTNILEKDGSFDEKLLTAFRAAIGKSVDGPEKSANLSVIRTKRSLLQKGKKRENLTKKLYGTSTGRRRSAWHRDWEVEFWKYRCSPGVNPEKIETLQSVLQLLKKSSEMDKETARGKKGENNDSFIKWALEILARKQASSVTSKDQDGDTDALKGNFPLLAQLHRIAEHYLQKANLDVIRRCADTELAIADAVNVEKDIYERSNSKLVYVNLCSQAARQPSKAKSGNEASAPTQKTEPGCDTTSQQVTSDSTEVSGSDMEDAVNGVVTTDQKNELGDDIVPEQTVCKQTFSFSSAEEALKEAGLFDSPPDSPERKSTALEGTSNPVIGGFSSAEEALKEAGLFDSPPNSPVRGITAVEEVSHRCTDDLDSEPSKILQSSSESRLKDVSSPKGDNSTVASCDKTKANSEEHLKLTASRETNDATTSETNAINLAEAERYERTSGTGKEISVESNMPDEGIEHVDNSKDKEKAASSLPDQSTTGDGSAREGEVISKPKNLESGREKSSGDSSSLNIKHPKRDKPAHRANGGDDSKKPTADQAKKSTSDSSSSIYKKVEMFVKEHIRPLCKSGVITVDQYRWSVAKNNGQGYELPS